jgi:hypothetical protein
MLRTAVCGLLGIDFPVPFTGQTAGLINEILPTAEIVLRPVVEAAGALEQAGRLASSR